MDFSIDPWVWKMAHSFWNFAFAVFVIIGIGTIYIGPLFLTAAFFIHEWHIPLWEFIQKQYEIWQNNKAEKEKNMPGDPR